MKTLVIYLASFVVAVAAHGQASMEKTMEQRAREFHRVIGINDPAVWEKFVRENYTKALIDKPMRAQVSGDGPAASSSETATDKDPVVAKAKMLKMLHRDFGDSKITSLKVTGETLTMTVAGEGLDGTFSLRFDKNKPYLIDGLGVEAGNVERKD